jgi:hypothetical protein
MSNPKVDEKGRVRCYPGGRKKGWKRLISKAARSLAKRVAAREASNEGR